MTVQELCRDTTRRLRATGVSNAEQEATWLVRHVLQLSLTSALVRGDIEVGADASEAVAQMVGRRLAGEPLQYVLGSTEFFGLELAVGPGVLIPRPETERLVELALGVYPGTGNVCDLCTGCGAIALSLASRLPPETLVYGVDISEVALGFALRNRDRLGAANVRFVHGDLFAPFPAETRFTLITANPPYVSSEEYAVLPSDVRDYEPGQALLAGADGLDVIRRVAVDARSWLLRDGWLLCEIGSSQGAVARAVFHDAGYRGVELVRDYADRDRVVRARM